MGAPYWRSDARGIITGLTRNSDWKIFVRAVIESVAYQSYDLFESMKKILIIGAGAMGAAFSIPCLDNKHKVTLSEP